MSFAVCRMQKMKSYDLKGMQFHNQRERESKTNHEIDKSRCHLNYDLVNPEKIDYNKRVKEIIEIQKTGKRQTRKDAVLVNELLVTSDRGFFDGLDEKEQKRFFEESYKLFAERYGERNIAYATVHNDEKTPHMHLGVVPMRDGKLQGKNVFNRQELQWIQDEFPKYLQKKGFDLQRGEKGSDREHLTTQEFKAKMLKDEINTLEESIKDKKSRLSDLGQSLDKVKSVDDIETKERGGLMRPKTVEIALEDFEDIRLLARASETLRDENKSLKIKNEKLQSDKNAVSLERELLKSENSDLKKDKEELQKENDFLKRTLEKDKEFYKEKIPEFAIVAGYIKAGILDKAKEKLLKKYFDKDEIEGAQKFVAKKQKQMEKEKLEKQQTRSRDRGMER
jgi:hypothetical protein